MSLVELNETAPGYMATSRTAQGFRLVLQMPNNLEHDGAHQRERAGLAEDRQFP